MKNQKKGIEGNKEIKKVKSIINQYGKMIAENKKIIKKLSK